MGNDNESGDNAGMVLDVMESPATTSGNAPENQPTEEGLKGELLVGVPVDLPVICRVEHMRNICTSMKNWLMLNVGISVLLIVLIVTSAILHSVYVDDCEPNDAFGKTTLCILTYMLIPYVIDFGLSLAGYLGTRKILDSGVIEDIDSIMCLAEPFKNDDQNSSYDSNEGDSELYIGEGETDMDDFDDDYDNGHYYDTIYESVHDHNTAEPGHAIYENLPTRVDNGNSSLGNRTHGYENIEDGVVHDDAVGITNGEVKNMLDNSTGLEEQSVARSMAMGKLMHTRDVQLREIRNMINNATGGVSKGVKSAMTRLQDLSEKIHSRKKENDIDQKHKQTWKSWLLRELQYRRRILLTSRIFVGLNVVPLIYILFFIVTGVDSINSTKVYRAQLTPPQYEMNQVCIASFAINWTLLALIGLHSVLRSLPLLRLFETSEDPVKV